ncbi:hypothetical protein [Staphylococcus gallinarum]|uniref:hypothetical protein n=1 Tax=Staphylococcus gallinarum TaxID=1293 RepID=UPI001E573277|nr:hypothetical protein [Staphylococcus gallinarum]MCD8845172.1 hypothetical protein [Staphylococcus gallinarum]
MTDREKLMERLSDRSKNNILTRIRLRISRENNEVLFYVQESKIIIASKLLPIDILNVVPNIEVSKLVDEDIIEYFEQWLIDINQKKIKDIPNEIFNVIVGLEEEIANKKSESMKKKAMKIDQDFWFQRLRSLLKEDIAKSRKHFMKIATYWYVLIEYEGYTEDQVVNVLAQDGFKMNEIIDNWNVESLSAFIEKVYYIASTKQIEYFIQLIQASSATEEVKLELIDSVMNSNMIDTWNPKEEIKSKKRDD